MPTEPSLRRRPKALIKRSGVVYLLPLVALTLTGCEQRFGLPNPATDQADEVLSLWLICLYAATALGVLIFGVLFYSLIRHRRRDNELPKQTEGSVPWEVTYTVIPFIIVGLLFAYGLKVQDTTTKLSKNPDVRVDVTGYQWNWRFEYRNVADTKAPAMVTLNGTGDGTAELVLPVNETVRLNLIAADVNHSFFIPGFLTKRDLIPGVRNEIEVTPKRTGMYVGHCAEYCGVNHSQMNLKVKVVTQAEYDSWLLQKGKA